MLADEDFRVWATCFTPSRSPAACASSSCGSRRPVDVSNACTTRSSSRFAPVGSRSRSRCRAWASSAPAVATGGSAGATGDAGSTGAGVSSPAPVSGMFRRCDSMVCNWLCRKGLERYSSNPRPRNRSRSPPNALAVTATTGVVGGVRKAKRSPGPRRNQPSASTPSMPGIWMSIMIRSKRSAHKARKPSSADDASCTRQPKWRSICPITSWFTGLSSTTRMWAAILRDEPPPAPATPDTPRIAWRSSALRTGLLTKRLKPTACARLASSGELIDDSMISFTSAKSGSVEIWPASCRPSSRGIFMSISAMSKLRAASRSAYSRSRACTPSFATTTSMPQAPSRFSSTVRLVSLSSTTSTRSAGMSCRSSMSTSTSLEAGNSGSRTQNREPTPGWLRTVIEPDISSTSWREIASPRPVPP